MDFRRHVTAGRVSEMFGTSQLDTDRYLRTMGWRRVVKQEWPLLNDSSKQNSDYIVERWTPVDSLAWLKAMAWDLRGNMETEIWRAALLAQG